MKNKKLRECIFDCHVPGVVKKRSKRLKIKAESKEKAKLRHKIILSSCLVSKSALWSNLLCAFGYDFRQQLQQLRSEFLQMYSGSSFDEDRLVHHCGAWCGPCKSEEHSLNRMDSILIKTMYRGRQVKPNKKVWLAARPLLSVK